MSYFNIPTVAQVAETRRGKPIFDPAMVKKFWARVERTSGCWLWRGGIKWNGYGRFSTGQRKCLPAHRFSYELLVGPIPQGLDLDHLCRNRACVNPAHLEPVTRQENLARSPETLPGKNLRKTNCPRGHQLQADPNPNYHRRLCVECRRMFDRRRRNDAGRRAYMKKYHREYRRRRQEARNASAV